MAEDQFLKDYDLVWTVAYEFLELEEEVFQALGVLLLTAANNVERLNERERRESTVWNQAVNVATTYQAWKAEIGM